LPALVFAAQSPYTGWQNVRYTRNVRRHSGPAPWSEEERGGLHAAYTTGENSMNKVVIEAVPDDARALLAYNLRRLRERDKMPQTALAQKAGLTHNFINDIENEKKWVSPDTLRKFAGVFHVGIYELFTPDAKLNTPDVQALVAEFDEMVRSALEELTVPYLKKRK
jgi:transcriptional regulator with XRE-family HTH domain